jgi:hypothetical protein
MCASRGCCWDSNTGACFYAADGAPNITQVFLIQSSHLDIGYADFPAEGRNGTITAVVNQYFEVYFPRAARIGAELRRRGGPERLKWMTHSWLVSVFFDCPRHAPDLRCPNATTVVVVEAAIRAGDIWWHALPFNAEMAVYDSATLAGALQLTRNLDAKFGLPPKTTLSTRDVPGMDRSIIGTLVANNVTAVSEGYNGSPFPANLPPAFMWRDDAAVVSSSPAAAAPIPTVAGVTPPSSQEVLALWADGYGSGGFEFPGCPAALGLVFRGDNAGPPESEAEVLADFARYRKMYPGAVVHASTFDEYITDHLLPASRGKLPVLSKEVLFE